MGFHQQAELDLTSPSPFTYRAALMAVAWALHSAGRKGIKAENTHWQRKRIPFPRLGEAQSHLQTVEKTQAHLSSVSKESEWGTLNTPMQDTFLQDVISAGLLRLKNSLLSGSWVRARRTRSTRLISGHRTKSVCSWPSQFPSGLHFQNAKAV